MLISVFRFLLVCILLAIPGFSQTPTPRRVAPKPKPATAPVKVVAPVAEPAPQPAARVISDPGPTVTAAPIVPPAPITTPLVRQGPSFEAKLIDRPQKVMFVKSQASDAKAAIANLLLSDVGLNLITMALAPQMGAWNPYMNDSIRKGLDLGKGMLVGHGSDTKGFEFETLPGTTADVTLKEGSAEFLIPMSGFVPSADFDPSSVQPVILKLEQREKDGARLLSSRQVQLKQNKTGRFDMKPTVDRKESNVEQRLVATNVERLPNNVIKVTPAEPLATGEYALVFRKAAEGGAYTSNVALKPTPPPAAEQPSMAGFQGMPGMTPEMLAAMNGSAAPAQGAKPPSRFGMLRGGGMGAAPAPAQPAVQPGAVGFIAFDFRVLK
jgi:hypothetical protein